MICQRAATAIYIESVTKRNKKTSDSSDKSRSRSEIARTTKRGIIMIRLEDSPNLTSYKAFFKCHRHILLHNNIMVSISGGADSDIVLDLVIRVAKDANISLDRFRFVFFNTGIEYQATLNHLDDLEAKYGIKIERHKAIVPVPIGCKKYVAPSVKGKG